MKTLRVTSECSARLTETWTIRVDDETATAIAADPNRFLDALSGNEIDCEVVSVEDEAHDEEDRDVTSVEILP